jgi:hypothetical protein
MDELKKCQLLCVKCHKLKNKKEGSIPKGSKNGFSKLNESDVIEIKTKIKQNCKLAALAKKFGVSHVCILLIKQGKTWGHVNVI